MPAYRQNVWVTFSPSLFFSRTTFLKHQSYFSKEKHRNRNYFSVFIFFWYSVSLIELYFIFLIYCLSFIVLVDFVFFLCVDVIFQFWFAYFSGLGLNFEICVGNFQPKNIESNKDPFGHQSFDRIHFSYLISKQVSMITSLSISDLELGYDWVYKIYVCQPWSDLARLK